MPFLPRGGRGQRPQGNEVSPQLDTEQEGKKNPRPNSRGRTFNIVGRGFWHHGAHRIPSKLYSSAQQVCFGQAGRR